jgi:hypothetical protein
MGCPRFATDCTLRPTTALKPAAVVHVHIGGLPFTQTLDEPVVFDEIHAAVTGARGLLRDFLPERCSNSSSRVVASTH